MIDSEDEKTKDLRKDKWRHLERKKIKQTKDWGEDTFWGWKKWLNDIDETKDLQDLQVLVSEDIYWEKKRLLQRKDCGEWGHTFGIKKILHRRKQKTIKEKRSGEWGHLLREKKRLLQTKDCDESGHTFRIKKS